MTHSNRAWIHYACCVINLGATGVALMFHSRPAAGLNFGVALFNLAGGAWFSYAANRQAKRGTP